MTKSLLYLTTVLLGSVASAAQLENIGWLTGHWASSDGTYEEVWLAPASGTMVGSFRWVFPDGRQVLEFLVIKETENEVLLRFKHFNTDYEAWEEQAPNTYRLKGYTSNQVTFVRVSDNADAPYTMTYRRDGGHLSFVGTGEPGSTQDPFRLDFELQ